MTTRTTILVIGLSLAVVASCGQPIPTTPVTTTSTTAPADQALVSDNPLITVAGATDSQIERLMLALARFEAAGLALPELEVLFPSDASGCKGHHGLFTTALEPWRISICSSLDSVYEHELAHAWAQMKLEEPARRAFMAYRGYDVWFAPDVPWNERGMEGVALVIQQGLGGLPLPPRLGAEQRSRLQAFELLTGAPAPILEDWVKESAVDCELRPTIASRLMPDMNGTVCSPGPRGIRHTRFLSSPHGGTMFRTRL